ncbi:hypothetical protein [Lichenibacterium dinghuense]|uniref:hypothetical protein n=1 Tax=Lichenibacterium dinghuense TaxID=2895977 RepID=UPI001F1EB74E|nr:hypothetical protein [Lichenibacterium sp. 6Y81]
MASTNDGPAPQVVALPGNGPSPSPDSVPPGAPAAVSARDFLRSLENAFGQLVTLKVVTVVGDVSVSGTGGDTVVATRPGTSVEAASTEVNLLDGHIVNVFSTGFAATGGDLQGFHKTQVEKSNDIMLRNLAELQKLASALATMRR